MAAFLTISQVKEYAETVQTVVQTVAVGVAAWWGYRKFVRRREDVPHVVFTVAIEIVGREQDQLLVELVAHFENRGAVRHEMDEVSFDLRCLHRGEQLVLGDERINGQVDFRHRVQAGSWIPAAWGFTFIEPQTTQRYSFLARAPASSSFLLLTGRFKYREPDDFHTAACVMAVEPGGERAFGGRAPDRSA